MACVICEDLERVVECRRSNYLEALSSAYYRVSTQVAAHKNVDMERAKNDLEEHKLACVAASGGDAAGNAKDPVESGQAVKLGATTKTDEHPLSRPVKYARKILGYRSASFLQSLTTALMVGTAAALIGVAAGATLYYDHVAWYVSAAAGPVANTLIVIFLVTIALEKARKRSIRRTLEIAFLNHHIHNAMTQMMMACNLTEADKQDRYTREAVSRVSEALFRVANNPDPTRLSLDVDLGGTELTREREERERQWGEKSA
jgi:hypothetical protein